MEATASLYGINDNEQIVGYAYTSGDTAYHAFLHSGSGALNPATDDLGTFGGTSSVAYGINSGGQVVGESLMSSDSISTLSYIVAAPNVGTDDLGTLGGLSATAFGINNNGQVVGESIVSNNSAFNAFSHSGSGTLNPATDDLGTFAGGDFSNPNSVARAINNCGQVVGEAYTSSGVYHAFLHSGSGSLNLATDDLGTLGGAYSWANGTNNEGQVVRDSLTSGYFGKTVTTPSYSATEQCRT